MNIIIINEYIDNYYMLLIITTCFWVFSFYKQFSYIIFSNQKYAAVKRKSNVNKLKMHLFTTYKMRLIGH